MQTKEMSSRDCEETCLDFQLTGTLERRSASGLRREFRRGQESILEMKANLHTKIIQRKFLSKISQLVTDTININHDASLRIPNPLVSNLFNPAGRILD